MNERPPRPEDGRRAGRRPEEHDDEVRRLLESADARPEVPAAHLQAIESAARKAWERQVRQRRAAQTPWLPRPLAMVLAASVAFALGLGGWWVWRGSAASAPVGRVVAVAGELRLAGAQETPAVDDALAPGSELTTGTGHTAVRLGEATILRLDSETRLRLVSTEAVGLERGAVYVETPGPAARLEVRTPLGTATDVGTRFVVRLHEGDEPALEVRVREGAVLTARDGRTWRAESGEALTVGPGGAAERRSIDPWGTGWEWVLAASPGFDLEGRTLGELLDWVARETGWEVELAEPAHAEAWRRIVLHGSVGAPGSEAARPDRMIFTVLPGAGLEGELVDGKLVVREAGES